VSNGGPAGPRSVLVTGASSGIGRAGALAAARAGDHLVLGARDESALEDTRDACLAAGASSALVTPLDVGDDEAVSRCVKEAAEVTGRLDVVLHAAGVVAYGRTEEVPADVFESVLRTNVLGSVNLARHVFPVLRRQERGTLVLVGSVIGHLGVPGMSPYVLSKWAVRALARQLQLENRDRPDVHVVHVAPGGVDTPIYRQAATYSGFVGRPPPPVASPDRVARRIWRLVDHPRPRAQLALTNDLMRFGFSATPRLYDALVGPLFALAAQDRTTRVPPGPGNVLSSTPAGNALTGDQGSALAGIARNLGALVGSRGTRGAR
jgi:NAD(P)-dependent dehydrogenase (short-subunit alcohol dehydrogenase family)